MGLSLPSDYCVTCHSEVGQERQTHAGLGFETCATVGCHNFHDNRALYEDFLLKHAHEPILLDSARLPARDFGARFRRFGRGSPVTAVLFDFDGKHLYFVRDDASALRRITLDGQNNATLQLPSTEQDIVFYIAQNPARRSELALLSFERAVYVSPDGGKSWKRIARPRGTPPPR